MRRQGNLTTYCFLALAILVYFSPSAVCQISAVSLLLQCSPPQGGTVSPGPGVYHFTPNTEVILIATPKPGYHFVCWLGEVTNPTENATVTYLNKPKIIIAVFEQTEYDAPLPSVSTTGNILGGAGGSFGGGAIASNVDLSQVVNGGGQPPGSNPTSEQPTPELPIPPLPIVVPEPPVPDTPTPQPPEPEPEPPRPEPPTPIPPVPPPTPPTPVPEPTTGVLFLLSGLFALNRRGCKK